MVKIERESKKQIIKKVEIGDLVIIGRDAFIAAYCNGNEECLLINLYDGNRWTDTVFEEGISESELVEYIDDPNSEVELIKRNQYETTIKIK